MEPELDIRKYEIQRRLCRFDEYVGDVFRICFSSWHGPPTGKQFLSVADFFAPFLLVHSIHSLKQGEQCDAYMVQFNFLVGRALHPLRVA